MGTSAEVPGAGPAEVDGCGSGTETSGIPFFLDAALATDCCAMLVMAVAARHMDDGIMLMDSLENPPSSPASWAGDCWGVLAAAGALFSLPRRGFFGVLLGKSMLPSDSPPPNFCVAGRRH